MSSLARSLPRLPPALRSLRAALAVCSVLATTLCWRSTPAQAEPLLQRFRGATIAAPDLARVEKDYTRYLGYTVRERGKVAGARGQLGCAARRRPALHPAEFRRASRRPHPRGARACRARLSSADDVRLEQHRDRRRRSGCDLRALQGRAFQGDRRAGEPHGLSEHPGVPGRRALRRSALSHQRDRRSQPLAAARAGRTDRPDLHHGRCRSRRAGDGRLVFHRLRPHERSDPHHPDQRRAARTAPAGGAGDADHDDAPRAAGQPVRARWLSAVGVRQARAPSATCRPASRSPP